MIASGPNLINFDLSGERESTFRPVFKGRRKKKPSLSRGKKEKEGKLKGGGRNKADRPIHSPTFFFSPKVHSYF